MTGSVADAATSSRPARRTAFWRRRHNGRGLGTAASVAITSALVGVLALCLMVWQLAIPRSFYTGTDSVAVRSIVAAVQPHQRLCVRGLALPADTGGVQLGLFAHRRVLQATVTISAGGRSWSTQTSAAPGPTGLAFAQGYFSRSPSTPASLPATVCMTPLNGEIDVGGMIGLQANQVPATLDGSPVANRVSVWFLPPRGEQRSLFSSAGDIFRRAALFRPGIIGTWTYPALLFVVLPLCWGMALVLLLRSAAGRRLRIPSALVVALIAFLNAASWALITPAFNAPDEYDHFAYAQYLAQSGHAPPHQANMRPPYSTDEVLALNAVRISSQIEATDGRPPWLSLDQQQWERARARAPHPAGNGGGPTAAASPHQPAYYALLAPAYLATSAQSPFSQLTAMRLMSALMGALVAACAFGVVRELLPRWPLAAAAAGLLVAFHPMFGFMSGAVNNDSAINAVAALALYLAIRGLRRGLTWPVGVGLGLALAIAPFMKETGYEIYPAVAVGVLGMLWRSRGRWRARLAGWAGLVGSALALRIAWQLLQPVFYPGTGAGAGGGGVAAGSALTAAEHQPGRFAVYLWELFLPRLSFMGQLFPAGQWPFKSIYVVRGWGAFGWYTWVFPNWVYLLIILAMAGAGVLAIVSALRAIPWVAAHVFELAMIVLFPVCVLLAVEAAFFTPTGGRFVVAEQGRYIFPAIAALAAIAVGATFALGRRWQPVLATAMVVGMIGLSYASQLLTLGSFFT